MRRYLAEFHVSFQNLNKRTIIAIVLLIVILLGWLDYTTGFEISFSFFYLIPITIATWYIDIKFGHAITILSISLWAISNWLAGQTYSQEIIRYWNASIRLVVFFIISDLINQLKSIIERERLLSRTDHLTGIANNREFYSQADLEFKRASRYGYPLSIAYIDLDNFKKVNDELGHQAGNRLLQSVANTISGEIRKTDIFARLGGDEFALLLPNTFQGSAEVVVKKIESVVNRHLKAIDSHVTLSIGVITYLSPPPSVDELIHKADEIMYQAKISGKGRTFYSQVE